LSSAASQTPVILFGLGATKAGTSWLHGYLDSHPEVRMPVTKEMHFFDARHLGRVPAERARQEGLRARMAGRMASAGGAGRARLSGRIEEIDRYMALLDSGAADAEFRDFLAGRGRGARLVGDITPGYVLRPEAVLARMQALAAQVRFIYILRDPVDRLWSNIRMAAGRKGGAAAQVARRAQVIFDRWLTGGHTEIAARSDYRGALELMARTLSPANLRIVFYERLFTAEAIDSLCRFLGLTRHPAEFAARVHASVPVPLDPVRAARARALLRPQYDYVARAMGELPARRRENMGE
jgi:hypothetical protein